MYKISVLLLILSLISCSENTNKWPAPEIISLDSSEGQRFIANNCVADDFAEGEKDNVYGLRCIEGKQILIKTSKQGTLVKTSVISDSANLKIAQDVDFINKYYSLSYTVLEGKGDDKNLPFLLKFFQEGESFTGNKDTEYRIIFKTVGNLLVLFKASENLKDIPYTERTSLKVWRAGEMKDYDCKKENLEKQECIDKNKVKKGDYYMVPFLAYPIKYCNAAAIKNVNNENTKKSRCVESHLQVSDYIKVNLNGKQDYNYNKDLKLDFFPADYFKGDWYFSIGLVEAPTSTGEKSTSSANLVKLQLQPGQMFFIDNSGSSDISEEDKQPLFKLPLKWLDFEAAQSGQGHWSQFGEREKQNNDDEIKSPYVSLGLKDIKTLSTPLSEIQVDWPKHIHIKSNIEQLEDVRIEEDYLSFSYRATLSTDGIDLRLQQVLTPLLAGKQAKWTISLLRLDSKKVSSEGFVPRKFFLKDFFKSRVFGIFPVFSQKIKKIGEDTEEELYDHARMTRFNLLLTEDEKKADKLDKPKTLEWRFSKNSTKDPEYRAVAKKAIDIYDRAFKYISKGKIRVALIEEEEKELGDLRYNLINLVEKDSNTDSGILGWGPSYANPNTGQIIGASANIYITPEKEGWFNTAKNYVQYELFEKDQNTTVENEVHVVSPYTKALIEDKCGNGEIEEGNVVKFVEENKPKVIDKSLKRDTDLKSKDMLLVCAKKIMLDRSLLALILHEMGHNFGLAHNFKASADKKNYYQTPEEIKKIFGDDFKFNEKILTQSSSVMDYIVSKAHPAMEYLGKYDLAALRYLYLDELEGKNGEPISLDINPDLEKQSPLTVAQLENRKDYLYCSDKFQEKEVFCQAYDYGATPKDIFEKNLLGFKMVFNFGRYRYDRNEYNPVDLGKMIKNSFSNLLYDSKWQKLRDGRLKKYGFDPVYKLNDQASIDKYKEIIEGENIPGTEYALYYPVREQFFQLIMEVMDYEEMTCHVRDEKTGKKSPLALEDIKSFFPHEEKREIKNCESFKDVFDDEGLILEHQTGFENFLSYYPYHSNDSINRFSVAPIQLIFEPPGFVSYANNTIDPHFMDWVHEPDLLEKLRLKTKQAINWEKNRTNVGALKSEILLSSYKSALQNVSDNTKTTEKQEIERELMNYSFGFRRYFVETGHNSSFDNLVEKPLRLNQHSNIDNTFLTEAYKDYISHDSPKEYQTSFQQYLRTQKTNEIVIAHTSSGKEVIITPYQKDSFSAKMIQEYHDKVSQNEEMSLKKLKERIGNSADNNPSLVDRLNKLALERYTNQLLERIKKEARN